MSSMIYLITTTNVSVEQGSLVPWQTIGRRITPMLQTAQSGVVLPCPGYYEVSGTVSFTAPATGDVVLAVRKAGIVVPGIYTSASVATANTEIHTVPYKGIIRVLPAEGPVTIDLINNGVAIDIINANLIVEYKK